MAAPDELREYKEFLVPYGGGYLRNTMWTSPTTCSYCAGISANPDYRDCYPCNWTYQPSPETSDKRGFVSYGWDHSQSAHVMYGCKEAVPNRQAYRLVSIMLFYALHEHLHCSADPVHGPPTAWATVPSLRDRGHPQALHTIASGLLRNMPEATLTRSDDVREPQSLRSENFTVRADVRGQHIVLIDDTWTTGGHAESAVAALKRAGATRVTLLILARWLDPGRGNTDAFMKHELTWDFDPDRCPLGAACR